MLKYDAAKMVERMKKGLETKGQIIEIADKMSKEGFSNIFFIGVGGTITYAWSIGETLKPLTTIEYYAEHAADFNTLGNKKFSKDSLVVVSSSTGDTKEVVEAVEKAKEAGARVIAFVGTPGTPLAEKADYYIPGGGYPAYYTLFLRLVHNNGEYPEFDEMYANLEKLPELMPSVAEGAEKDAEEFARIHRDDAIQYLIGSGNMWGPTYSYAMCIMEEMQWMRTKSITAGDFFHGTLEVIGRDDSVILFYGEDATRPQMERAEKFLHTICKNVTVFDTAKYELPGIDPKFRGLFSPIVLSGITGRIGVYLEEYGKHPMPIRRYYRKLDY